MNFKHIMLYGEKLTSTCSTLFAPQTGLAFHTWLFLCRVTCRNSCAGWVFAIECNTFEVNAAPPPPNMIHRVIIKLPCMCDVIGKWSVPVSGYCSDDIWLYMA